MALQRCSLQAFLVHVKSQLQHAVSRGQRVTFVVGNQSADLDSFSAALSFAYLRSLNPPRTAFTPLYTPVLNLHREDLQIRPEFLTVFRHSGIDSEHILTLDDLWSYLPSGRLGQDQDTKLPFTQETARWVLVDHNKPEGELMEKLALTVCGVVDHHEDEYCVAEDTEPEPRIIEKCGSCTSLVVRLLAESWETGIRESRTSCGDENAVQTIQNQDTAVRTQKDHLADTVVWDAQLARLALASILIDTTNLTDANKVENADREAVEFLEYKASNDHSSTWSRTAFFEEISTAKKSVQSIDFLALLRKDYKQWTEKDIVIGISSVPTSIVSLVPKARECLGELPLSNSTTVLPDEVALKEAIARFQCNRAIEVYALMTTFTEPEDNTFRRELLIQTLDSTDRTDGLLRTFEISCEGEKEFGLEPTALIDSETGLGSRDSKALGNERTKAAIKEMRIWNQREVGKSRKQVAPFLRRVVRDLSKV